MNIIEVKNNLVKLNYDEDITLSSFIKISDLRNAYIAQILHLESSRTGKTAIARLIFNFKCGIQAYDGSVPSIQSEIEILDDDFFLNSLDKTEPLLIGKLAQKDTDVVVSSKLLMDKPVICAEKSYQYSLLVENLIKQNEESSRKTVVLDITGEIKGNKITATEDFKIPLDKNSIDYIFDRGFDDLTRENKAFIQDIFSELNDYIKTVEYIPFSDFNAVIDYEFKRTQQLQLIILKNRLTQFEKLGIFAHEQKEFKILDEKLKSDNTIIIDLSKLSDTLQTEYINYIYTRMNEQNTNFYAVVSLNNNNSTKETLHAILGAKNVFPLITCPYSYKYITELKQCSKNMFMFTPVKQQADFGAYNIYLNKLAEDEFILYGKATKFTPLIVKLEEITDFSAIIPEEKEEFAMPSLSIDTAEEEPVMEIPVEEPVIVEEVEEVEDEPEQVIIEEEPVMEMPVEEPIVEEEIVEEEIIQEIEEVPEEEPVMELPEEEEPKDFVIEKQDEPQEENDYSEELKAQLANINISDDEIADIVAQTKGQEIIKGVNDNIGEIVEEPVMEEPVMEAPVEEVRPSLDPSDLFKAASQEETPKPEVVMEEQPSEEDATELTDADLDMIDSMEGGGISQEEEEVVVEEEPVMEMPVEEHSETNQEEMEEPTQTQPQEKKTSITDELLQEEAERKAREEESKPDPVEEMIEKPQTPPPAKQKNQALETKESNTPIVPVYSAEIPDEDIVESDPINQGDRIEHPEFGRGVVEKIINYGDRTLCSVNFEQVGRRLLDPKISELKKV